MECVVCMPEIVPRESRTQTGQHQECGIRFAVDFNGTTGSSSFWTHYVSSFSAADSEKPRSRLNGKAATVAMVSKGIRWITPVVSLNGLFGHPGR